MTTTEKLVVINQIWDDLIRNPDDVPSPEWHREVLSARAERVKRVNLIGPTQKGPGFLQGLFFYQQLVKRVLPVESTTLSPITGPPSRR